MIENEISKKIEYISTKLINSKILDLGCGKQNYKKFFFRNIYHGIDIVKNNPEIKSDKFYDGLKIPYDSNYFDCVICTEVVSHVKDLDVFFSEMRRVIKEDGFIVITTPFISALSEYPNDFRRFTLAGLINYCKKNKFQILDHEKLLTGKHSIERIIYSEIHKYNIKKKKNYSGLKKFIFTLYVNLTLKFTKFLFILLQKINGFEDVYANNFIVIRKDEIPQKKIV